MVTLHVSHKQQPEEVLKIAKGVSAREYSCYFMPYQRQDIQTDIKRN